MSGSDVAAAAEKLETAIYECIQRSESIKHDDMHLVLNLLSGKLRAKGDQLRESVQGVSDDDLLDEDTDGE